MTYEERYLKYKKEQCINCKNQETKLCDIKVSIIYDIVQTKCNGYERKY